MANGSVSTTHLESVKFFQNDSVQVRYISFGSTKCRSN